MLRVGKRRAAALKPPKPVFAPANWHGAWFLAVLGGIAKANSVGVQQGFAS